VDPIVLSYQTPDHDLDVVARHIYREGLAQRMVHWKNISLADEMIYLATCQRATWIFWGGKPEMLNFTDAHIKRGPHAWTHLLSLATGLESANVGDREITEQLNDALKISKEMGMSGEESSAVVADVIRESRRLRTELGLADGTASIATAALRHLMSALSVDSSILIIGFGPMSQYIARRLHEKGYRVTLSNRTESKVGKLANELGVPTIPLEVVQQDPQNFDALITSTGSVTPIFTYNQWKRVSQRKPLRILDLALPADSEPALQQLPWINRVDLSVFLVETDINRQRRIEVSSQAEPFIVGASQRLRKRSQDRTKKRSMLSARETLSASWDALEEEVKNMKALTPDQYAAVQELLIRGRTLSYRALVQGLEPDTHLKNVAEILRLDIS
jgi:glutamyl-tRNA reductase